MKRKLLLVGIVVLLLVALVPLAASAADEGNPDVTQLLAGQNIDVGEVQVWDDGTTLFVKYLIDADLTPDDPSDDGVPTLITAVHLHVADDESNIPQNKQGLPQIGQFMVNETFDPGITEITFEFDLADNGWTPGQHLAIAAHAVVEKKGGLAGVELALPDQVTISVLRTGDSYFTTTVSGGTVLDGVYEGWCVDTDRQINTGSSYSANVYSSYYEPLSPDFVDVPGNMELVNWLINQGFVGQYSGVPDQNGNDTQYTYGDVQRAIWQLIEDVQSTSGLGDWDKDRVNQLVAAAQASGEGFVPGCGDQVAILLVPVNASGATSAQVTIVAQVTFIELGVPCETIEETAWAEGMYFNEKKSWAMYFSYGPTVEVGDPGTWTKAASVRYKGVNSGGEIFLGTMTSTSATPRVEVNYNWPEGEMTYPVTFSYDKTNNSIATTIGNPANKSLIFDFDDAGNEPPCAPADWDVMEIFVRDGKDDSAIKLENVTLGSFVLGDFGQYDVLGKSSELWTVSGFDFSQDFTITADLLTNGFKGNEAVKFEFSPGCLAP